MSDYEFLHEAEDVWLVSDHRRPAEEVWAVLKSCGFTLHDDVFELERSGRVPMWQSSSAASVSIFLGDTEVYDEDGEWDRVRLRHLLATLPETEAETFIDAVRKVAELLRLPMVHRGDLVSTAELKTAFSRYANELRESIGAPGAKDVRMFIESMYPRR